MAKGNKEVKFDILHKIAELSERNEKGWCKELNIVKWGENKPKYDIRDWNQDHTSCGKGVTLTRGECDVLFDGIDSMKDYGVM